MTYRIVGSQSAAICIALALMIQSAAAVERQGAFVGGGLGVGSFELADDFVYDFAGDDDMLVGQAHGGYRLNSWFALEGKVLAAVNDSDYDIEEASFVAISGRAVGLIPLGERVDLFGLLGLYVGESDIGWSGSEDEAGLMYGAGVQLNLGSRGNLGFRAEYEFYDAGELIDEFDAVTLSFQYNFFK
jgi:hypothetical protein